MVIAHIMALACVMVLARVTVLACVIQLARVMVSDSVIMLYHFIVLACGMVLEQCFGVNLYYGVIPFYGFHNYVINFAGLG